VWFLFVFWLASSVFLKTSKTLKQGGCPFVVRASWRLFRNFMYHMYSVFIFKWIAETHLLLLQHHLESDAYYILPIVCVNVYNALITGVKNKIFIPSFRELQDSVSGKFLLGRKRRIPFVHQTVHFLWSVST